jgi:DNA-binding XRE family transcriptional regulator
MEFSRFEYEHVRTDRGAALRPVPDKGNPQFAFVVITFDLWYSRFMLQEKLGQRIAELRKARGLTQGRLAKAVGCSVEFVSLVERGVNAPSVAGLEKFAAVLKAKVVDLFTFKRQQPTARNRARKSVLRKRRSI